MVAGAGCDLSRNCHGGFHRHGAGTTADRTPYRWKVWTDRWCEYSGHGISAGGEEPYFLVPELLHRDTLFVVVRTADTTQTVFGTGRRISPEMQRHLVHLPDGDRPPNADHYKMIVRELESTGLTRRYFAREESVSSSWLPALEERLGGALLGTNVHIGATGDRCLRLAWTAKTGPDAATAHGPTAPDYVLPPVRPVRVLVHDRLALATYWELSSRKVVALAIEEQTGLILWDAVLQLPERQGRLVSLSVSPHVAGPYVVFEVDGQYKPTREGDSLGGWYEKAIWVVGTQRGHSLALWPLEKGVNFGRHSGGRPGLRPWPESHGLPPRLVITRDTALCFYSANPWAVTPDDEGDRYPRARSDRSAEAGPMVRGRDRYAFLINAVDAISGAEKWFSRVPLEQMFARDADAPPDTEWVGSQPFDPFVTGSGQGFDPQVPTTNFLPMGQQQLVFVAGSYATAESKRTDGPQPQRAAVVCIDHQTGIVERTTLLDRAGIGFSRLFEREGNVIVCSTNTLTAFAARDLADGRYVQQAIVSAQPTTERPADEVARPTQVARPVAQAEPTRSSLPSATPTPSAAVVQESSVAPRAAEPATASRAPAPSAAAAPATPARAKPAPKRAVRFQPELPSVRRPKIGPAAVRPTGPALPAPPATKRPLRVRLNPPRWSRGRATRRPRPGAVPPPRAGLRGRTATPVGRDSPTVRPRFQLLPDTRPTTRPTRTRRRRSTSTHNPKKLPQGLVPYAAPE